MRWRSAVVLGLVGGLMCVGLRLGLVALQRLLTGHGGMLAEDAALQAA